MGVCMKCGRKLTDPDSIRRGYGPECWYQITGERAKKKEEADPGSDDDQIEGQMSIFDYQEYGIKQ